MKTKGTLKVRSAHSLLAALATALAALPALADVTRITEKVTLDGRFDEPFWAKAEWQGDFKHLVVHKDDRPAVNATEFALAADATTLYLGVKCHETQMDRLRAIPPKPIWNADALEIFFCPSGRSFDFYQFVVPYHAAVEKVQLFASESGNISPDPYAAPWQVARAEMTDGWSVEIAIPFSSFYMTRNEAWRGEWLFNLGRYCDAINERTSWRQVFKGYREPDRFGKIAGFPMRRAADDVAMTNVRAELTERRDGKMIGHLAFDAQVAEAGVYTVVSPVATTTDVALRAGLNKVSVPCGFTEIGRHSIEVALVRKATQERYLRTYPVRVDFEEIRVRLTSPEYRDNFYPGQDSTLVKGVVKVAVKGEVKLTLEGPGIPKSVKTPDASGSFVFETPHFADGEAFLTVEAGEAKKVVRIRKIAPTGHRMSWISKGCLVVNGKPVFRRGVYSPGYRRSEAFKERLDNDKRLYLTPEANGYGGPLEPAIVIGGLGVKEQGRDIRPCAEYFRKVDAMIEKYRDKDFVAYYISDEPECRSLSPVYLQHIYEYVKEKDPYHVILTSTRAGKTYIDCADWLETHPYPGPYYDMAGKRNYTNPFNRIGDFIDAFEAADRPDKCIGFLPMMFAYRGASPLYDYPTFPEYVCHTWAALLRGARSLYPYAEHDMGDRPSIYEGNRYVNSSAEALQEFLLHARRTTLLKTSEAECVRWDLPSGEAMFALVNMKTEPQTVAVPALKGAFREFRGTRTFDCRDAAGATFALEPLEVVVGTTDVRDAGLETYAEAKAVTDRLEYERTHRDNQILEKSTEISIETSRGKGEYYKLVDGVHDMLSFQHAWAKDAFIEIDFKKTLVFPKVRVYGNHLEKLAAAIWKDGAWVSLTPKAVKTEKWMRELDFGESVASEKIRLTFTDGKNSIRNLEVYEVEIGKVGGAQGGAHAELAEMVAEDVVRPVRPGGVDGRPFWNENALWFMYPPAFDFKEVKGAKGYLFSVRDNVQQEWTMKADRPTAAIVDVWTNLPPGLTVATCYGVDAAGEVIGRAGARRFWKQAAFNPGKYPQAKYSYREAARRLLTFLVDEWKPSQVLYRTGRPDFVYQCNGYPAKIGSALINAMLLAAEELPEKAAKALDIAKKEADYLLTITPKEGPLAYFTPTYEYHPEAEGRHRLAPGVCKKHAGECMIRYAAEVGIAMLRLCRATGERKYGDFAVRCGETFLRLQRPDGTWPCVMRYSDGKAMRRDDSILIERIGFFEMLREHTGDRRYAKIEKDILAHVENNQMKTWDWQGQFEDTSIAPKPYRDLTGTDALPAACYLLEKFPNDAKRVAMARELIRFGEDQFTCWERPCRADGACPRSGLVVEGRWYDATFTTWYCPGVSEQYACMVPIDASACRMIWGYLALHRVTGDRLALAKAYALGDSLVNKQQANGGIETYWYETGMRLTESCDEIDWLNCMADDAEVLLDLAKEAKRRDSASNRRIRE